SHEAFVFHQLLQAGERGWAVTGVCMRSPEVRDQLAPQDGLYTLLVRGREGSRAIVSGAIKRVLLAAEPEAVIAAIADPAVALVTLTITEKGYEPRGPAWPLLFGALEDRRALDAPLTILSCDNLVNNGARTRDTLLAAIDDPLLARWVERNCAFPSSMVDRITPVTTPADLDEVERRLGVRDEGAVVTEPFWQWVVEDTFAGLRPPLETAGVEMVADVAPFEQAKLRLLNAAHSTMAYVGLSLGLDHVHQAVGLPPLRALVERLWDEAVETMTPADGLDTDDYRTALIARFENPALAHRLLQIAEDGSRKLPERILKPLEERTVADRDSPAMVFALAAWLNCIELGAVPLVDPNLGLLRDKIKGDGFAAMGQAGMIADPAWVYPPLRRALADQRKRIRDQGIAEALVELLRG